MVGPYNAGSLTIGLGPSKSGQTEMWVVSHIRVDIARQKCGLHSICCWGPTGCCQLSGKLSRSFFWLALGVALDLRTVVAFAPSWGTPLASMGSFSTDGIFTVYLAET